MENLMKVFEMDPAKALGKKGIELIANLPKLANPEHAAQIGRMLSHTRCSES